MVRIPALLVLGLVIARPALAQSTDSEFPASVGRMYAASTSQVWKDVQRLLADGGIKTEVKNDNGRFLVTQPIRVEASRFGFEITDVIPNATSGLVKLHIFVPKYVEPARVYVGSTLTVELPDRSGTARMLLYSPEVFGVWLLGKMSEKLSLTAHRIPQDPIRRSALAKSLLSGSHGRCLDVVEGGKQSTETAKNWMTPRRLHEVPLIYPRSGALNKTERELSVSAVIGEDGFPWPIGVVNGRPDDEFSVTALGSISLWRFAPLVVDGCPAPIRITTSVRFVVP